jgi:hypothetical protein
MLLLHEIAPISTMRCLPAAVAATAAPAQSFPPTLPIRSGCPALRPNIRIGPGNSRTTGARASDQPASRTWHLQYPDTWPAPSNLGDGLQSLSSIPYCHPQCLREKRGQVCYALGPWRRRRDPTRQSLIDQPSAWLWCTTSGPQETPRVSTERPPDLDRPPIATSTSAKLDEPNQWDMVQVDLRGGRCWSRADAR